jgi:hypothetical protein
MLSNLNKFERAARIGVGALLLILSFSVFVHPIARLLVILAGAWLVLEGAMGACPFYASLGIKKPSPVHPQAIFELMVGGVQVALGYVWWHAGWIKMWSGNFSESLQPILRRYAEGNPHFFIHNCLQNFSQPYVGFYAGIIEVTQYFIGIMLIALAYAWLALKEEAPRRAALYLSVVGLLAGAIMNGVFYFAIGHLDAWAAAGNVIMFWSQLVLAYGFINLLKNKHTRS